MEGRLFPSRGLGFVSLLAALALAALSLGAGCSAPAPTPTSAPSKGAAAPAAPPLAAAQPAATVAPVAAGGPAPTGSPDPTRIKDTLTVGYGVDAETFDPHYTRGTGTAAMTSLVYEQLVTRDPKTMELKPMLALSWKNLDPRTWEFKLRQGVKFQNGEEFDAESVKVSFDRMTRSNINSIAKSFIEGIYDAVEIVDPYTVRIRTKEADPLWLSRIAPEGVNMIPPKWARSTDDKTMAQKPVGSGPYKLLEFVPGDRSVLERFDGYWGEKPPTQRLVWKTIPDVRTRLAALQRGEVDMAKDLTEELVQIVEKDPNLKVHYSPNTSTHKIVFNVSQSGPKYLQDKRVRQALNHAVDKPALIKGLFDGKASEYHSVIVKEMAEYRAGQPYEYNPEKARKLLAEAGYPDGFETEIWVAIAKWPMAEQVVQAVADYFGKVGVRAKIRTAEWAVYQQQASSHKMPTMFYYPHVNRMWEPDNTLGYFLAERKRWNYYLPPESTQELIRKAAQEFDEKKRRDLYIQAQTALWEDTPYLTLWQPNYIFGMSKKLQGFIQSPDGTDRFRNAYVEK